jgi:hypothetical protein
MAGLLRAVSIIMARKLVDRHHPFQADLDRTGEIGIHLAANTLRAFIDEEECAGLGGVLEALG